MATIIHLVRHGEVHNPDAVLYARLPRFRLSDEGQAQAAAAAAYFADRPLAAVFASPMLRARQTATHIVAHHPLKMRTSKLINETYTPHAGKPLEPLRENGWKLFEGIPPEYDTLDDIFARLQRFLTRTRKEYAGQEVAAVTHGHVLLWSHLWVRGLPFNMETQFLVEPFPETASITTLTFNDGAELPTLTYHRPY